MNVELQETTYSGCGLTTRRDLVENSEPLTVHDFGSDRLLQLWQILLSVLRRGVMVITVRRRIIEDLVLNGLLDLREVIERARGRRVLGCGYRIVFQIDWGGGRGWNIEVFFVKLLHFRF